VPAGDVNTRRGEQIRDGDHMQPPAVAGALTPAQNASGLIERIISQVPTSDVEAAADPARAAEKLAREAARNAAMVSASLALPPGPLGMLTVLPDLFLIWKIQRQLVADIFALHGRTVELTRTHMLYCLFRHMASQVLRDVVVRAGERAIVRQLSSHALTSTLQSLGLTVVKRLAGSSGQPLDPARRSRRRRRYAYWDTLQVAKTAEAFSRRRRPRAAMQAWRRARRLRQLAFRHVRPLRAPQPSGRDRAGVRPRAAARRAGPLQHRADDRRADRARRCRRAPRARAACVGDSCRAGRRTRRWARG
jgi:hypothetical protein